MELRASSGSVVPIFRSQIDHGGPVTVTDPEMTRYFMTIPEAVQLVIQAGDLGTGASEVFVLEMGEPVKIIDLARNMIRLAGKIPHKEIEIVFTGGRPGEKINEVLVSEGESIIDIGVDRVQQLTEIIAAAEGPAPDVPASLSTDDADLLNPARWRAPA